jgi:hypothetical protein
MAEYSLGLSHWFNGRQWYVGTLFIGVLAMAPLYTGAGLVLEGPIDRWTSDAWFATIVLSLVTGVIHGDRWWRSHEGLKPKKRSPNDPPPPPRLKYPPWK